MQTCQPITAVGIDSITTDNPLQTESSNKRAKIKEGKKAFM